MTSRATQPPVRLGPGPLHLGEFVSDAHQHHVGLLANHDVLFAHGLNSGLTPVPTVQDKAENSDDSTPDGIQGDDTDQQECQHHQGRATLPIAVSPRHRNSGNAEEERNGEDHPAGLGEPKPLSEPSPIAPESRHARSLGRRN